ncbi:hypothetical protein MKX03_020016, partial [Papaver bracteatum]
MSKGLLGASGIMAADAIITEAGFGPSAAYLLSMQEYMAAERKQGKKHTVQEFNETVHFHCSLVSNFSAYGSGVTSVAFDPTHGGSVIAVVIVKGQCMSPYDPDEGPSITGRRVQCWESSLQPVVFHPIFGSPTSSFGGQPPMQTVMGYQSQQKHTSNEGIE